MHEASAFAAMYNYERKTRGGSKRAGSSTGMRRRNSGLGAGGGASGQQGSSASAASTTGASASRGGSAFHPGQQLHDARIYNVIKVAWVKNDRDAPRHIAAHCNYIEKRDRGHAEKERNFFTRERDAVPRAEVVQMIMDNRGAMYSGKAMYKVILSPNTNDLDRQDMTRTLMDRFEKETGCRLHWAAVEHENTLHNHVHIVIAAMKENGRQFSLKPKELEQLRAIGHEYQFEIRHEYLQERDLIAKEMSYFREYAHELTQREVDRQQGIEIGIINPRVDERAAEILRTDLERDRENMHEFGLDKYYYNVEKDFKDLKDQQEQIYIEQIRELAKEHPELFPGLEKDQSNLVFQLQGRSPDKQEPETKQDDRALPNAQDERHPGVNAMVESLYQYADLSRSVEEMAIEQESEDKYPYPDLRDVDARLSLPEIDRSEDQDSSFVYDLAANHVYEEVDMDGQDQDFGDLWGEDDSQPVYEEPTTDIQSVEEDRDERDDEDYF